VGIAQHPLTEPARYFLQKGPGESPRGGDHHFCTASTDTACPKTLKPKILNPKTLKKYFCRKALVKVPEEATIFFALGKTHAGMRKWEEAAEFHGQAVIHVSDSACLGKLKLG
jgi:hypothetical protein